MEAVIDSAPLSAATSSRKVGLPPVVEQLLDEIDTQQNRALAIAFALEVQLGRRVMGTDFGDPTALHLAGSAVQILEGNASLRDLRRALERATYGPAECQSVVLPRACFEKVKHGLLTANDAGVARQGILSCADDGLTHELVCALELVDKQQESAVCDALEALRTATV